ncbi:MAG: hypothetical protein WDO73_22940 [Ignavibacteriota bacterium]
MTDNMTDGAIKLFLTSRALCFRKSHPDLLTKGSYLPLRVVGDRQNHVVSFARGHDGKCVIAAAGPLLYVVGRGNRPSPSETPHGAIRCCCCAAIARIQPIATFSAGARSRPSNAMVSVCCRLPAVFAHMPVALLESME